MVILEGAFGEVENELLVTSLVAKDTPYAHGVQIAAPPLEEELTLERWSDELPWLAAPLEPPATLRAQHLARALTHSEARRASVVDRLLGGQKANLLVEWVQEGHAQLRARRVLLPAAYQPEEEWLVARSASAPELTELDVQCVAPEPVRLFHEETGETLERVDADLAGTRYYPGAVLLLEQGRFQVTPSADRWRIEGGYAASLLERRLGSIPERTWTPAESLWNLTSTDRSVGRQILRCRAGALELRQRVSRVRLYGADGQLIEGRDLSPAIENTLETRILLLMTSVPIEPSPAPLRPIVAALTMLAPSMIRAAREVLHVGLVEAGGCAHIALFDRTPGGNGFTSVIDETLLVTMLRVALAVLGAMPEPLRARLRERFDQHPGATARSWDVPGAIAWLGAILEPDDGAAPAPPQHPEPDTALLRRIAACFPPIEWYPPEEAALLCEWVATALTVVPTRARFGAQPTDEDKLLAAVGLGSVFYRRPDLKRPEGFHIAFEPGEECHQIPGCGGYCRVLSDWHIGVALEPLRRSKALDGFALMTHEAAHLMDALDGTVDGLLSGMSSSERKAWLRGAANEMPRAATGSSVLKPYAATNAKEFLAEAVAAFVELPTELKRHLPSVYAGLRAALRQDLATWIAGSRRG